MWSATEKLESDASKCDESPATIRIRKTQHAALQREFIELMQKYQLEQVTYRDRCKERIKRQVEITGQVYDDEQVS